ncbi:class I SAM-dependent methyltransferase [Desulfocicer niacini]
MIDQARKELFDNWAVQYDEAVSSSTGQYPFDGYDDALSAVVTLAKPRPGSMVLDLGTGTGNLAERFASQGCTVWGVDFSEAMLEKARVKFPEINLVYADLLGEWPQTLPTTFDLVVSAYVLHEFDMINKVRLISRVAEKYLKPGGRILIADIAFPSAAARDAAAETWRDTWDDTEHYWVAEEMLEVIEGAGFKMQFQQVSSCANIFQLSKTG